MSHTTSISDIVFSDIAALESAVKELQKSGVNCTLVKNATPRAYYANQTGMGEAPYVLQLGGAKYDVGFYWNDQKKGYEARSDFFGGSVAGALGAKAATAEEGERAKLGKLYQMYGVHAATRKAVQSGYSVRRMTKPDGTISLVMGVK